jgi:chromosomal replication initiation ATPase DnaA
LDISLTALHSPLIILGQAGQGKTVLLLQLALELIRQQQPGVLYDPYGDLVSRIMQSAQSASARQFITTQFDPDKFTVITGNKLQDGLAITQQQAQVELKKIYAQNNAKGVMIIDEAFAIADDELLQYYISSPFKTILSDATLIDLSAQQRDTLLQNTKQLVLYNTRTIDSKILAEYFPSISARELTAIEQFHFYWVDGENPQYYISLYPVQPI